MGPSVRIYNLAKGLALLGHEVQIIVPGNNRTYKQVNGVTVHYVTGMSPQVILRVFSKLLGVSRPTSLFFYDIGFILKAIRLVRKSDLVQIEEQEAGGLLIPIISKILKKKTVVDCHDVFQALRIRDTSIIRRILETSLERIAYKYSDSILCVSEKEKELLVLCGIEKTKIYVVSNGVDTNAFSKLTDVASIKDQYGLKGFYIVTFVGNMEYLPNQEAVKIIASEIAPKVQKKISNAKFLIVGRISSKIESSNLIFTGVVDNVADLLAVSDVAISPLIHGSGTRLKILEYFSCSLPVVSTSLGVEGLDVKDKTHLLIEDDSNEFAIQIIRLLDDELMREKLGNAARDLVVNKYDWRGIVRQLSEFYKTML
jgi:glycosyltransferase involved in cell wall biosynthesis